MNITTLLTMIADGFGERVANGSRSTGMTYAELLAHAGRGAQIIRTAGVERVVFLTPNGAAFPVALFAAAWAGVPIVPLNYRLGAEPLAELRAANEPALTILDSTAGQGTPGNQAGELVGTELSASAWLDLTAPTGEDADAGEPPEPWSDDPEAIAVLLYTSGTTAAPKAAVLRHRHLTAYVLGNVEFAGADEKDAALVSVPPYHIAGVSNTLSNTFAGRRIVYLSQFTPENWLTTVRSEGITNALVVPTMLARVVEHLGDTERADAPTLATLAYGGAPMPAVVVERALKLFGDVDFVNAYGLTETSSTVAVLDPQSHRDAAASTDPTIRARLGSAGQIVPGVEAEIRGPAGEVLPPGEAGELYLRGGQISGEYLGRPAAVDDAGWFPTRDRAWLDGDGYLFIEGRSDDTIIRGGENIAPAEIEDAISRHPAVTDVAVVGLPDVEWGQRIAAVVVTREGAVVTADELRDWVRALLRSSKTPDEIHFLPDLPRTDTGKLLRRKLVAELS